ncbi:MAG: hypothetical protein H7318_08045 [Oligoflexus sp.]|nr:hypothetical protein [Oligoflexus sp.]
MQLIQCSSTRSTPGSRLLASQPTVTDFCVLSGIERDPNSQGFWSAETVDYQITQLIEDPAVYGTPWMAYPSAYRRMTAARDVSRCQGALQTIDKVNASLNHLLSDIMTRWYVLTVQQCAHSQAKLGTNAGFCPHMNRMRLERYDSLSAAMSSTAIYLSSHIALSVSAMAFDDAFWDQMPDPETHNDGSRPRAKVMNARVIAIKRFKPVFDNFNAFLGNNLSVVAGALQESKLLNGSVLNFASNLSRVIPLRSFAFGKTRDDAFATALDLIETLQPAQHPMIRVEGERAGLNRGKFAFNFVYPAKLKALEDAALFSFANRANMQIYRRVLGGKSWDEVESEFKLGLPPRSK